MRIHGTSAANPTQRIHAPHGVKPPAGGKVQATSGDQLDLSAAAQAAADAQQVGEVRQDVVARVRAEIANGSYETPEKLDIALDRLLDSLD